MPSSPSRYIERSFLELYLHATGTSETPSIYHQWCALSTIAACVADRVWIEKFKGKKIAPNLYLILLGPSGNGKGTAMGFSEGLIRDLPNLNLWNGMITAPRLIDKLGKAKVVTDTITGKKHKVLDNSKIMLMTPELASSVGEGVMADKFVKLMTALYEGHTDWDTGTRTSGDVKITNCNINWIAGSTPQWLVECLPKSSIDSGFLARTIVAQADYDYDKRIPIPIPPIDYDAVHAHLKYRCIEYANLHGEFDVEDQAYELQHSWYMTRPREHNTALEAAWHRDDDLSWKLSMIFSLAEGCEMMIRSRHMILAQKFISRAHKDLPKLLTMASQTPETETSDLMSKLIKKAKRITHRSLMQQLGARGKRARDIKDAAFQLKSMDEIEFEKGPRGGTIYKWKG